MGLIGGWDLTSYYAPSAQLRHQTAHLGCKLRWSGWANDPIGKMTPIGTYREPIGKVTPIGIFKDFQKPIGKRTPIGTATSDPIGKSNPIGPIGKVTSIGNGTPIGKMTPIGTIGISILSGFRGGIDISFLSKCWRSGMSKALGQQIQIAKSR